jgi:hypothetical protein
MTLEFINVDLGQFTSRRLNLFIWALASSLLFLSLRRGGFLRAEKRNLDLPLIKDVSIIDLLVLDHQALKNSCEFIQKNKDDRSSLIFEGRKFLQALGIHSEAEKETLYKKLVSNEELHFNILEAEAEHRIIDQKIRSLTPKLKNLKRVKEEILADLIVLSEIVQIHLLEEEGELFSRINEEVDEATLIELGEMFIKRRDFKAHDLTDFPILENQLMEWKDSMQKMQGRYFAQLERSIERLKL